VVYSRDSSIPHPRRSLANSHWTRWHTCVVSAAGRGNICGTDCPAVQPVSAGRNSTNKVIKPVQPSDFRPSHLCSHDHLKGALIVKSYIYPALLEPPSGLCFRDEFVFRPSGSTATAIITLLHTVLTMLSANDYVRVIALDFSKVFDTIRHATLIEKNCQPTDARSHLQLDEGLFRRAQPLHEICWVHLSPGEYPGQCHTRICHRSGIVRSDSSRPSGYT